MNHPSILRTNRDARRRATGRARKDAADKLEICRICAKRGMLIPFPDVWEASLRLSWPDGVPFELMLPVYDARRHFRVMTASWNAELAENMATLKRAHNAMAEEVGLFWGRFP